MAETETEVATQEVQNENEQPLRISGVKVGGKEVEPPSVIGAPVRKNREARGTRTAGEKFEGIDSKVAAPKPLKTAAELAQETEEAKAETFPDNFKDSLALLQKLNAELVSTEEEWQAKQPLLNALKAHVFQVQQGLPPSPSKADDHASVWVKRNEDVKRQKLEILGRSNPEVKELLAEHDALKKQVEQHDAAPIKK